MMSRFRLTAVALMLVFGLVFLAACGGSDESASEGNGAETTANEEGGDEANIEEAKELAAEYEKTKGVEFPEPTESFDPGKGKVAIVSCGNAGINCLKGSEDAQTAAKAMGWTPSPILDGEFNPAKQAGFVQQAVQEGYDGIVLVSMDAQSIKSAVDAAAAKEIPIACVMCVNPAFEGKVVDTSTGGVAGGEAIGDWIVANSDGESAILGYDDKSFPIVAVRRKYAEEQIEELCPDCEIENADFPTPDLEKPGSPTFEAALAANPSGTLDFVMAPYDPAAIPMAKAAEQSGRSDFKMTGYDASPEFVEMIQKGGVAAATTAAPFPYASWSAIDQVARINAGLESWESNRMPIALVTETNASQFLETGGFFKPADFDFEAMFRELWGK